MKQSQIKWTPDLVACHFEEAAETTKLLPPVRVQGYGKSLPDVVRTPHELALIELEWMKEKKKPKPDPKPKQRPTAAAISRRDQTLEWMPWLKETQERKLIWRRAAGDSCGVIGRVLGLDPSTIWDRWRRVLNTLSKHLNKRGIQPSEAVIVRAQQGKR